MAYPPIAPFPATPSASTSPGTFSNDADGFLGAIPDFCADVNAIAGYLDGVSNAANYFASLRNAEIVNLVGVYNPALTYAVGDCVFYNGTFWLALEAYNGVSLDLNFLNSAYASQSGLPGQGDSWLQIRTIQGGFF